MTIWNRAPLGELARVVGGTTPPTHEPENYGGEIVWITPTDLGKLRSALVVTSGRTITKLARERAGLELLPVGTVLMSSRAPIGHLGIAMVPLCTNQGCKSFVPGPRLDSWFLYYSLRSKMSDIRALGAGATFAEVSKSDLERFEISFPPIDVQRRIASAVTLEFKAADHARQRSHERLAQTRVLRENVLDAAFNGLSASDKEPLGRTGALHDGDWILTADYSPNGVRLFQVGDIGRGRLLARSNRYISGNRADELKCTLLRAGDILISRMPDPIGRACVVPDLGYEAITAVDVTIFRPDSLILDTEYAVQFMNSRSWLRAVAGKASGATRARISRLNLELLEVPVPKLETQRRIASELRERLAAIDVIEASLQAEQEAIEALPAALLRRAFDGLAA